MSTAGTRPVFRGINTLLSVIERLCHRQSFWHRARPDEDRGETPLPLLCLVRTPGADGFLKTLSAKLDERRAREIPHVLIDADEQSARHSDPERSVFTNPEPDQPELGRFRIANDKMLSIIRFEDITDAEAPPDCVYAIGDIPDVLKPECPHTVTD